MSGKKNKRSVNRKRMAGRSGQVKIPGAELTLHRRRILALAKTANDAGSSSFVKLDDFFASDIQSLFQVYCIKKVKVTFRLVNAPNNNAVFPTLHIAPQRFTTTSPTSLDEVRQYDKLTTYQFGPSKVQYSRTFVPGQRLMLDNGTSVPGHISSPVWTSVVNADAVYPFMVFWIQRYNSTSASSHDIEIDFDITVTGKGPR